MGGNHYPVKRLRRAVSMFQDDAIGIAMNGYNIGSRIYLALELIEKRLDIGVAAACHIVPLRMAVDCQQPIDCQKSVRR